MFQADVLLSGSSQRQTRGALVWLEDLEALIQTDTRWSIDQRLDFTLIFEGDTAEGVLEVRGWHARVMRCCIVRISPESARKLHDWQDMLPTDRPELSTETLAPSGRRGRSALTDALRSRVRQIRAARDI